MFPLCLPKIASSSLDPMFTDSMICHNALKQYFGYSFFLYTKDYIFWWNKFGSPSLNLNY